MTQQFCAAVFPLEESKHRTSIWAFLEAQFIVTPKSRTAPMSTSRWTEKQGMLAPCCGILLSHEKEWGTDSCCIVDEPSEHGPKGRTQNITCCRDSFVWNTPKRQTCKRGTETSGYLGLIRKLRLNGREESKGGWWKSSRTGLWRWSYNSVNFLEVMALYNLRRWYLWCRNIPGWGCLKKEGGRQRKSPQQEVISYCNIVTFLYVPLVSIWIHTFF